MWNVLGQKLRSENSNGIFKGRIVTQDYDWSLRIVLVQPNGVDIINLFLIQFGYSADSSMRDEEKSADGVVSGRYNYIDTNGAIQTVNYVADEAGFRVTGAVPVQVWSNQTSIQGRSSPLRSTGL